MQYFLELLMKHDYMSSTHLRSLSLSKKVYFVTIFACALFLLYIFFPKQERFELEYQKGSPWKHETLLAPFDFPLLKTELEVQQEQDELMMSFYPYFNIIDGVENENITKLRTDVEQVILDHSLEHSLEIKMYLIELFSSYYWNGIMEHSIDKNKALDGKKNLMRVRGNIAEKVSVDDVYSLKSAYLNISRDVKEKSIEYVEMLTILKTIDLNDYISANMKLDEEKTNKSLEELMGQLSSTKGFVQAGERIIFEGEKVDGLNLIQLNSLQQAYQKQNSNSGWFSDFLVGQFLIVIFLMIMLTIYLNNYNQKIFLQKRNYTFIISAVVSAVALGALASTMEVSFYIMPFCIVPLIVRIFLGGRMSIFIHIVAMLIVSFMVPSSFEFILLQICAGVIGVISLSKLHRRGQIVLTALQITMTYAVLYIGFSLMREGSFAMIQWRDLVWFVASGVMTLLTYPVVYIFERLFGFVSDVALMEFSNTNHPLLRRLADEAPGTFQHSMQVGNLAEEVVTKIGGNPMLVRTGAWYHDIGKMLDSGYFTENQGGGDSPHTRLSPEQSAKLIVNHVSAGVTLAKKHKLPDAIIEFITSHHGKSSAKYFLLKYKEAHPNEVVDESIFQYPGPNPRTRETAVLMLADGVEAAARSLTEKNQESLKKIIDVIVDTKVKSGELDEAPLTFQDITHTKEIFLEKLLAYYHVRIKYPDQEKE